MRSLGKVAGRKTNATMIRRWRREGKALAGLPTRGVEKRLK